MPFGTEEMFAALTNPNSAPPPAQEPTDPGFFAGIPVGTALQQLGIPQNDGMANQNALPADAPMPDIPGVTSAGGGFGGSVSSSSSDPNKVTAFENQAKRPGGYQGRMQDISNQQNSELGAQAEAENQAAEANKTAIGAESEAQRNQILAQGVENSKLAKLNQDFAIEESKQSAMAAQKTAQYMANYEAALADFRAAKVDPSQLWGAMTPGEHVGTLASVFVHDFLGARGIHTSVMDTLNQAIDRNIASQVENINKKGKVADMFRNLWDMSVQQSRTDEEARARVRGFMLESFKGQVASELSGYDSKLAEAKGMAAMAAVDTELTKQKGDLVKIAQNNHNADKEAATQAYVAQVHASAQRDAAQLDYNAKMAALNQKPGATSEQVEKINALAIQDPESGKTLGVAHTVEEANALRKQMAEGYASMSNVMRYVDLVDKVGKKYPANAPLASVINGADASLLEAARLNALMDIDRAKGGVRAAGSSQYLEKTKSLLTENNWTTREGRQKAIGTAAMVEENARQAVLSSLGADLQQPSEDEAKLIRPGIKQDFSGPVSGFAEGVGTKGKALLDSKGELTKSKVEDLDATVRAADGKDMEPADKFTDQTQTEFHAVFPNGVQTGAQTGGSDAHDTSAYAKNVASAESIPAWAGAMSKLHAIITDHNNNYSADEKQAAMERLGSYASAPSLADSFTDTLKGHNPNGSEQRPLDDDMRNFAQYLLMDITAGEGGRKFNETADRYSKFGF